MPTQYHGKYGQVDVGPSTVATANHWDLDERADSDQFSRFGSNKKTVKVGTSVATGTIRGKQDFDNPVEQYLYTGMSVTLKLYDTTTASGAAAARYWTVAAEIVGFRPTTNTEGVPEWEANWEGEVTSRPSGV